MLLVHRFNGFLRFLSRFSKVFLQNWFKNLRTQSGLYQKRAGVRTPGTPPLDARLFAENRLILEAKFEDGPL